MLQFFRKFQKAIFTVLTVIIVISFSFFGTYGAIDKAQKQEAKTAFVTLRGEKIDEQELELFVRFLATDFTDYQKFGAPLGPNFFNDGVIRKDFLETGAANLLFTRFQEEWRQDWDMLLAKEKKYHPYTHPQMPFFSAETVWGHFAPTVLEAWKGYQKEASQGGERAFSAKVALYLAEDQFPPLYLKQVLLMQMRQNPWMQPDPQLYEKDLSLFGYHTASDWFGQGFIKTLGAFILQSADIAVDRGYTATKEEALADMKERAYQAYSSPVVAQQLGEISFDEFFRQQLRLLGTDTKGATRLWQKVLLFRKLFYDIVHSPLVAKEPYLPYVKEAATKLQMKCYHLPEALHLSSFHEGLRFESYLQQTAKNPSFDLANLAPKQQLEEVAPEFLSKKFVVDIVEVSSNELFHRIGLKDLWAWQESDAGWQALCQEIPALALTEASTAQERYEAICALDATTKERVDAKSRKAIVAAHPEWLEEALDGKQPERKTLTFYRKGGKSPLRGIPAPERAIVELEEHHVVTWSGETTYRVEVLEQSQLWELATFAETKASGSLEAFYTRRLEEHYNSMQSSGLSNNFKQADGTPKPLQDVLDLVAEEAFRKEILAVKKQLGSTLSLDQIASSRLQPYLAHKVQQVRQRELAESDEPALDETPYLQQFALVEKAMVWDRAQKDLPKPFDELMHLEPHVLSSVVPANSGDLYVYSLEKLDTSGAKEALDVLVKGIQKDLSCGLWHTMMEEMLELIPTSSLVSSKTPALEEASS